MSLTNFDIITICNVVINKDLSGQSVKTSEFQTLINTQSQLLFAEKLGVPNRYQLDAPIERKGAGVSRAISQELRPFLVTETVATTGGQVDLTGKGIGYLLAAEGVSISGRGFQELKPSEYASVVGDPIITPTEDDPALTYVDNNTILISPSTLTQVVLKYYKYPPDAVVVTSTNSSTLKEEYDAGASTELLWEDSQKIEIAYRILQDLGINMERADVFQYATKVVEND